ncbi:DUF3618 domain-containing protein [Actinomadura sp. KC345]|uniref:DUF3618 domain-containing protein n=1 Tax=Actinomadura sp. KC345 TaxID=2530371 RepID=UPI00104CB59B|nr:DUF3618 domain-containing protein [Actinomadura sp. KC345]TDC58105.1 DUF3618 domain-containing protein [Actinomadura sp. KC345]
MADRPSDPEGLERYIERNVQELALVVDEFADRVHPKKVAQRGADRLKEEAGQVAKAVGALVRPSADEEGDDVPGGGGVDKRLVLAGVGAAVTVTALVLLSRRRKRR